MKIRNLSKSLSQQSFAASNRLISSGLLGLDGLIRRDRRESLSVERCNELCRLSATEEPSSSESKRYESTSNDNSKKSKSSPARFASVVCDNDWRRRLPPCEVSSLCSPTEPSNADCPRTLPLSEINELMVNYALNNTLTRNATMNHGPNQPTCCSHATLDVLLAINKKNQSYSSI